MERIDDVLYLDYLDVHNIRYTLEKGELSLLQFFEMQEFLHGISLWGLKDIALPEEHQDLKELIWDTIKHFKK